MNSLCLRTKISEISRDGKTSLPFRKTVLEQLACTTKSRRPVKRSSRGAELEIAGSSAAFFLARRSGHFVAGNEQMTGDGSINAARGHFGGVGGGIERASPETFKWDFQETTAVRIFTAIARSESIGVYERERRCLLGYSFRCTLAKHGFWLYFRWNESRFERPTLGLYVRHYLRY